MHKTRKTTMVRKPEVSASPAEVIDVVGVSSDEDDDRRSVVAVEKSDENKMKAEDPPSLPPGIRLTGSVLLSTQDSDRYLLNQWVEHVKLLNQPEKCDLIIKVADGKFYAHSSVFYSVSPLLRELLEQDCGCGETQQRIMIIPDLHAKEMAALLDLIYTGRCDVSKSILLRIKSALNLLEINQVDLQNMSGAWLSLKAGSVGRRKLVELQKNRFADSRCASLPGSRKAKVPEESWAPGPQSAKCNSLSIVPANQQQRPNDVTSSRGNSDDYPMQDLNQADQSSQDQAAAVCGNAAAVAASANPASSAFGPPPPRFMDPAMQGNFFFANPMMNPYFNGAYNPYIFNPQYYYFQQQQQQQYQQYMHQVYSQGMFNSQMGCAPGNQVGSVVNEHGREFSPQVVSRQILEQEASCVDLRSRAELYQHEVNGETQVKETAAVAGNSALQSNIRFEEGSRSTEELAYINTNATNKTESNVEDNQLDSTDLQEYPSLHNQPIQVDDMIMEDQHIAGVEFTCPQCDAIFPTKSRMKTHIFYKHRYKQVAALFPRNQKDCPKCEKSFTSTYMFLKHYEMSHSQAMRQLLSMKEPKKKRRSGKWILEDNGLKTVIPVDNTTNSFEKSNIEESLSKAGTDEPYYSHHNDHDYENSSWSFSCCSLEMSFKDFLLHCVRYHARRQLQLELMPVYDEFNGKCLECGRDFSTIHAYCDHIGVHHQRVIKYIINDKRFKDYKHILSSLSQLDFQQREQGHNSNGRSQSPFAPGTGEKELPACPVCKRRDSNKSLIGRHLVDAHYYDKLKDYLTDDYLTGKTCSCPANISSLRNYIRHFAINHDVLSMFGSPAVRQFLKDMNNSKKFGKGSRSQSLPHEILSYKRKSSDAGFFESMAKQEEPSGSMSKPVTRATASRAAIFQCKLCNSSKTGYKSFLSHLANSHYRLNLKNEFGFPAGNKQEDFPCPRCDEVLKPSNYYSHIGSKHEEVLKFAKWFNPRDKETDNCDKLSEVDLQSSQSEVEDDEDLLENTLSADDGEESQSYRLA